MVWKYGRYQLLGNIQRKRIGRGGNNGGRGNVDCGNNPHNCRVRLFQQGESNRTPVTGIGGTTIYAE